MFCICSRKFRIRLRGAISLLRLTRVLPGSSIAAHIVATLTVCFIAQVGLEKSDNWDCRLVDKVSVLISYVLTLSCASVRAGLFISILTALLLHSLKRCRKGPKHNNGLYHCPVSLSHPDTFGRQLCSFPPSVQRDRVRPHLTLFSSDSHQQVRVCAFRSALSRSQHCHHSAESSPARGRNKELWGFESSRSRAPRRHPLSFNAGSHCDHILFGIARLVDVSLSLFLRLRGFVTNSVGLFPLMIAAVYATVWPLVSLFRLRARMSTKW